MSIGPIGLGGMAAVAFELAETDDEIREMSRDTRRAEQRAQVQDLLRQADHIEDAAERSGLGTIVGGAASIGSGGLAVAGATGGLPESTAAATTKLSEGSGRATQGICEVLAGQQDADAKRCEARAQAHAAAAAEAGDVEQEARAAVDEVVRRLEAAQGLLAEARSAALRA